MNGRRAVSLFSGVGGFDLGLERAGWTIVAQVEYDRQCRQVLRHHWPETELYGDVKDVAGGRADAKRQRCGGESSRRPTARSGGGIHHRTDTTNGGDTRTALPVCDLICGGFPCQDLSVAGKRAGLDGDRSGLWFEFHRILAEAAPRWVLIENVPGLLSSNGGRDMAVVLGGLAELGYGWAYRVLDSQYFGVAQRRRRVFIIGHLGTPEPAIRTLFPVGTGLPGDTAPSRKTREDVAGTIGGRAKGEGGHRQDLDNHGAYPVTHTLRAEGFDASEDGTGRGVPTVAWPETAMPLMERDYKGPHNYRDGGIQNMCVQSVPRRLTPRECERLQGFPDDWTLVDGMKDGPRYRMMGNAVTVNVAEWIGRRILETASTEGGE